jgi:hypothetical protein
MMFDIVPPASATALAMISRQKQFAHRIAWLADPPPVQSVLSPQQQRIGQLVRHG